MAYPRKLEALRERFDKALEKHFASLDGPESLREAMAYSLFAGGKRIRPVMLLAAHQMVQGRDGEGIDPEPAACSIEFIHTYSLIHDDLPAMDDDDLRRGRPTSHKRFGEAMAVLAGDALLTEAFGLMARKYANDRTEAGLGALAELAAAAGASGMVGGQVLDIRLTGQELTQADLERIHRMKTGALLVSAVRCGGILAGADGPTLAALTLYGQQAGLAFQVADDVLDVIGDRARLGKSIGKDEAQGKTTYAALMGLEGARDYVKDLTTGAIAALVPFEGRADPLIALAGFIQDSIHPSVTKATEDEAHKRSISHTIRHQKACI